MDANGNENYPDRLFRLCQEVEAAQRILKRTPSQSPRCEVKGTQAVCDIISSNADFGAAGQIYGVNVAPLLVWIERVADAWEDDQAVDLAGWPEARAALTMLRAAIAKADESDSAASEQTTVVAESSVRLSLDALAAAMITQHPDWTNVKIAKEIPCHVKNLSTRDTPTFMRIRRMLKSQRDRYRTES